MNWEMKPLRTVAPRRPTWLDALARRAVLAGLGRIDGGRIEVQEGDQAWNIGTGPHRASIRVLDARFYRMAALRGAIGAADAYRLGYWEANDLTSLFRCFVRGIGKESKLERAVAWIGSLPGYAAHLMRRNGRSDSRRNIEAHYDLGNDFFELFLDSTMTYSGGIFPRSVSTLREASLAKLRRIADKLELRPGMHVCEIGCGWGSFAILAAQEYGCHVTCVTLSNEQHAEATRRVAAAGVSHLVDIRLQDYRDLKGPFDRIASIEMIEAIGHARMGEFFATCDRLLKPDGTMAIQVITMPDQGYARYLRRTDVIRHMIFPGSNCPARTAVLHAATRRSQFRTVHLEEIGPHYATTLRRWRESFVARLSEARELGYSPEFLRLWHFYLCYCEAGFEERHVGTVQMVFTKPAYRGPLAFAESESLTSTKESPYVHHSS